MPDLARPLTKLQKRLSMEAQRNRRVTDRFAEITPEFVEALYEKVREREWRCDVHGPVGLKVNSINECVEKVGKDDEGVVLLCGKSCHHDGPLMATPKEIGAALSLATRQTGSRDMMLARNGLLGKLLDKNETIKSGLVLNLSAAEFAALPDAMQRELETKLLGQINGRPRLELPVPVAAEVRDATEAPSG